MVKLHLRRQATYSNTANLKSNQNIDEKNKDKTLIRLHKSLKFGRITNDEVDVKLCAAKNKGVISCQSMISRRHAEIIHRTNASGDDEYLLVDCSLNGTYLNDFRVPRFDKGTPVNLSECVLKEGDLIKFGHLNGAHVKAGEFAPQACSEFTFSVERTQPKHECEFQNVDSKGTDYSVYCFGDSPWVIRHDEKLLENLTAEQRQLVESVKPSEPAEMLPNSLGFRKPPTNTNATNGSTSNESLAQFLNNFMHLNSYLTPHQLLLHGHSNLLNMTTSVQNNPFFNYNYTQAMTTPSTSILPGLLNPSLAAAMVATTSQQQQHHQQQQQPLHQQQQQLHQQHQQHQLRQQQQPAQQQSSMPSTAPLPIDQQGGLLITVDQAAAHNNLRPEILRVGNPAQYPVNLSLPKPIASRQPLTTQKDDDDIIFVNEVSATAPRSNNETVVQTMDQNRISSSTGETSPNAKENGAGTSEPILQSPIPTECDSSVPSPPKKAMSIAGPSTSLPESVQIYVPSTADDNEDQEDEEEVDVESTDDVDPIAASTTSASASQSTAGDPPAPPFEGPSRPATVASNVASATSASSDEVNPTAIEEADEDRHTASTASSVDDVDETPLSLPSTPVCSKEPTVSTDNTNTDDVAGQSEDIPTEEVVSPRGAKVEKEKAAKQKKVEKKKVEKKESIDGGGSSGKRKERKKELDNLLEDTERANSTPYSRKVHPKGHRRLTDEDLVEKMARKEKKRKEKREKEGQTANGAGTLETIRKRMKQLSDEESTSSDDDEEEEPRVAKKTPVSKAVVTPVEKKKIVAKAQKSETETEDEYDEDEKTKGRPRKVARLSDKKAGRGRRSEPKSESGAKTAQKRKKGGKAKTHSSEDEDTDEVVSPAAPAAMQDEAADPRDSCGFALIGKCKLTSNTEHWVACDHCGQWFHTLCATGNNVEYELDHFSCKKCTKKVSPLKRSPAGTSNPKSNLRGGKAKKSDTPGVKRPRMAYVE